MLLICIQQAAMLIYLSYLGLMLFAKGFPVKLLENFYRILFTYFLTAGLFKLLLISLLGISMFENIKGDTQILRLVRIGLYIVEILVWIFIILPIIKRYIEYKKRQDIKATGRDIVVMQQEKSPLLLRKTWTGRLNPSEDLSKDDILRSFKTLKQAS